MALQNKIYIAAVCLSLGACSPKLSEVSRASRQDGKLDAVVAVRETDATVATPSEVYIVGKGETNLVDPVFRADNVDDLTISWKGRDLLVRAKKARVFLKEDIYKDSRTGSDVNVGVFDEDEVK